VNTYLNFNATSDLKAQCIQRKNYKTNSTSSNSTQIRRECKYMYNHNPNTVWSTTKCPCSLLNISNNLNMFSSPNLSNSLNIFNNHNHNSYNSHNILLLNSSLNPRSQQPQSGMSVQQPQSESSAQQPADKHVQSGPPGWQNGLMGCCDDCGSCWLTMCCPCVQYGKNYEKVHKDGCCSQGLLCCLLGSICLSCCIHKELRSDIRQRYHIFGGSDCCVAFFCAGCAICQEARELKDRH